MQNSSRKMKTERKDLTFTYSLIQMSYWMSFCICVCFAVIYLQGKGLSNTQLGIVTALGNLAGMLIGPYTAGKMDAGMTPLKAAFVLLSLRLLSMIGLLLCKSGVLVIGILFVLYMAFCVSANTVVLKIYSDIVYEKYPVNYATARGLGSLAFVIVSSIAGTLIEKTSVEAVPWLGIVLLVLEVLSFYRIGRYLKVNHAETQEETSSSIAAFIKENGLLTLTLSGTALLFFSHNIVTNFLINIVRHVGGTTAMAGYLTSFMALMELPVMFLYTKLFGKKDQGKMLAISAIAFTIKELAFALANSQLTLSACFLLQAPSFAIYSSAIVPYVASKVEYKDAGKGQSLAYTMTDVGAILAGFFAGRMYDTIGVSLTLWVGFAVSLLGTLICLFGLRKGERR